MKKTNNNITKFAIIVLAVTMVVFILVSGTYAKYTSQATGSDTAKVAKWSIKVGDTEIANATPKTVTFDLFKTINDSNGTDAESDVKSGKLIAPGTSGKFDLTVTNDSEVNAKCSITLANSNTTIPIEFSTDGKTWTNDITTLASNDKTINMGASSTMTVQWRWAYEGSSSTSFKTTQTDTSDTNLGISAQTAAPTATITATIVATQVD